jgi:hypothetical protein
MAEKKEKSKRLTFLVSYVTDTGGAGFADISFEPCKKWWTMSSSEKFGLVIADVKRLQGIDSKKVVVTNIVNLDKVFE